MRRSGSAVSTRSCARPRRRSRAGTGRERRATALHQRLVAPLRAHVLDEKDPLASALLLVSGDGEDGRLEVRELFRMDLHARLVVLSACETGLGQLSRGDELVGLQRAFFYAGTPAVVTTLWKVDDRASFVLTRSPRTGRRRHCAVRSARASPRSRTRST